MKQLFALLFLSCFFSVFSQSSFERMPENMKEIHFEYESKSNFYYNEVGIYADTLLLKFELPNLKYFKTKHPEENYTCGYVPFSNMDFETKNKVASILYHSNEKFVAVYNLKKNITTIVATRNDENLKKLFKNIFKKEYSNFTYTIYLNYNKLIKKTIFPKADYEHKFKEIQKTIEWTDNLNGSYSEKRNNLLLSNIIKIDENLSKQITLGFVFGNNNFGISKVSSVFITHELKSVTYR